MEALLQKVKGTYLGNVVCSSFLLEHETVFSSFSVEKDGVKMAQEKNAVDAAKLASDAEKDVAVSSGEELKKEKQDDNAEPIPLRAPVVYEPSQDPRNMTSIPTQEYFYKVLYEQKEVELDGEKLFVVDDMIYKNMRML